MICKACNAENAPDSAFCAKCGASLTDPNPNPATAATSLSVDPGKTMNLVSMILGIAALSLSTMAPCSCGQIEASDYMLVFGLSIASIILGIMGINKSKAACFNGKQGKIGIILSILASVILILITVILVIAIIVLMFTSGAFEEIYEHFFVSL